MTKESSMQLLADADLDAVTGGINIRIGEIGPIQIGNVSTGNVRTGNAVGTNANSSVAIAAGINAAAFA